LLIRFCLNKHTAKLELIDGISKKFIDSHFKILATRGPQELWNYGLGLKMSSGSNSLHKTLAKMKISDRFIKPRGKLVTFFITDGILLIPNDVKCF